VSARTTTAVERPAVPVPRDGWVQVANAFIDAAPLDNERLAHVILMSYAWDEEACHPYQGELAARLGVSVRTIKRRVGELRAAALVTVERGGGQDHPNVYHLHVRPVHAAGDDEAVRFTTVLHRALDDATLSQGAKRAYIVLCRRAGGNGWCPCSNAALGAAIGVRPRVVYDYVRELADAGYLRLTERPGRSNRYTVETPARRKRSAGPGAIPPLAAVPAPTEGAAADARWRALYVELMRVEPTKRLGRRVRTLLADVGEATVLEAIGGAAEFAARVHARALTIGMIRVEVGKIRGEEQTTPDVRAAVESVQIVLPPPGMEPVWRDTLTALRGEMTPENYKRWLEPTTVVGLDGELLRVGVPDAFSQQWLDKRLRRPIERALARAAPSVRVVFEIRGGGEEIVVANADTEHPPPAVAAVTPARASPPAPATLTIDRCAHCHYAPCRCSRQERRARERAARKILL